MAGLIKKMCLLTTWNLMMSVQEDLHPAKLFMIYFIQSTLFHIYKMFVEDGVEPSGGQAQKLAIARALYKNAPIVILDEPTAALENSWYLYCFICFVINSMWRFAR